MELKKKIGNLVAQFKKYKFAVLILIIGLVLMMLPPFGQKETKSPVTEVTEKEPETLQLQIGQILSKIEGAGRVEVLLTTSAGEEIVFQTDMDNSSDETSDRSNIKTVTVTNSERDQSGLIRQIKSPKYQGAVVVCQGADIPSVQLAVVDAVSKLTGLGANQISVLKMK
mgnify:CR=1 FL=1